LKGLTNNVGAVFNRAAINVMPSEFEGFGIALVETMAYGVPSIAFEECNGPNEIIENAVSGYLVQSEKELASTLTSMINGDYELNSISSNAKEKSLEYSKNTVFPLWEKSSTRQYYD
jgi:glycosyltransferase involved in cell wall biosynthesis